jgi:hypothetical protein
MMHPSGFTFPQTRLKPLASVNAPVAQAMICVAKRETIQSALPFTLELRRAASPRVRRSSDRRRDDVSAPVPVD